MLTTTATQDLDHKSGEELLLLAIFGPQRMKPRIDRELDRRALSATAGGTGLVPHPSQLNVTYAA